MPSGAEIEARAPVWEAFSEFFLDTELGAEDHERIARLLARTRFPVDELEAILVHEVRPVCRGNLLSVAGEWQGFDPDWIRRKAASRLGRRPWFHLGLFDRWMFGRHWTVVRARIVALRSEA
jgi:hypothetical protein